MSKLFSTLVSYAFLLFILGLIAILGVFSYYGKSVDDYRVLASYEPPVTSRLYAGDGRLLAEYASEKRVFVPYENIPDQLVHAFISAEDKNFFTHGGIDFFGILRAVVSNVRNIGSGRRMEGASTITQQVAKNFLLTNEVSFERKIKEAILASRIERAFSKEYIMELYLNQIYLGNYSYGVASAALNYFNKSLDELTIGDMAFLAALPKGPNNYDPVKKSEAALARRNWVLSRMEQEGYITPEECREAQEKPIETAKRAEHETTTDAEYFAEEVRRDIVARYGEEALYSGGLAVRTTVDPQMQKYAAAALRNGLISYDRNHGYRKPLDHLDLQEVMDAFAEKQAEEFAEKEAMQDSAVADEPAPEQAQTAESETPAVPEKQFWQDALSQIKIPDYTPAGWTAAIVLETTDDEAKIGLPDGAEGQIPLAELTWARKNKSDQSVGEKITQPSQVLKEGDVILVQPVKYGLRGVAYKENSYGLRQIPAIEGAMVVLDPHTGRILAMVGGFSFKKSQFNRAVQAKRQPGSSFKPFVYLAALDEGFTPSTLILDAPFVMDQGPGMPKWKPKNYSNRFYGPTTLRMGIEKSRNLMTVRLAKAIGIEKVVEYAKKLGISDDIPNQMSIALGSGETTVMRLAAAYGILVNGGKKISPVLIDRIQDRTGATVYNSDARPCRKCRDENGWRGEKPPVIPDLREQLVDPRSAYQIINIMTGVLAPGGSASSLRGLGRTFAGKTGTSNSSMDGWFVGVTPNLVVAVFMGFDEPRTLGKNVTGGAIATPVFREFVKTALKDVPPVPFRVPPNIRLVRVNHKTGLPAKPTDKDVVLEAFKIEENWKKTGPVIDGADNDDETETSEKQEEPDDNMNTTVEEIDDNIPEVGGVF